MTNLGFGLLRNADESIKTIMVKYGGQYLGRSQGAFRFKKIQEDNIVTTMTTVKKIYRNIHPKIKFKNILKRN